MVLSFARTPKRLLQKTILSPLLRLSPRPQATGSARLGTTWLLPLHLQHKTQSRSRMAGTILFATLVNTTIFLADHAANVITASGMDTTCNTPTDGGNIRMSRINDCFSR